MVAIRSQKSFPAADAVLADPRAQDFGNEDRCRRPADSFRGWRSSARLMATAVPLSVWTKCVPFSPLCFVADVEAAGLVVGAVAGAGDFAVLAAVAAAGHPGFEVELAIGRAAEVAAWRCRSRGRECPGRRRSGTPGRRSSSCIASLCSGSVKANISTLVNWCTRYSPRVARPAAPASVRKQWLMPQSLSGSLLRVEDLAGVACRRA